MFTIGFIGRFEKVKRPDLLKQIIIALKGSQMEDSCQFLLCGGGSFYEQLREELEPLNVKFIGWTQDLAQIYSSLDLMILTSDNEGTPLSIIEAGMMGVPTLSRNVGGIPTLIEDNKTGFLCGETSEDFVKRIIELTLSENIIRKVSLNVEDLYRKKFSVQDFIRNYSHLYRNGKPNHL